MQGARASVERLTGIRPDECPFRAFDDPFVWEVIAAHRWYETGQLALVLGNDPDADLLEAINVYHSAVTNVMSDYKQRQQRKATQRHG